MAINAISVISTNNKLVFILIFVIDNTSIYKTYVVKSSFSTKKKKKSSKIYIISNIPHSIKRMNESWERVVSSQLRENC